jgi:hypothetical protein
MTKGVGITHEENYFSLNLSDGFIFGFLSWLFYRAGDNEYAASNLGEFNRRIRGDCSYD